MVVIKMKKIIFTGSFWDYFLKALGLILLSIITFGLGFIYFSYWSVKYFVTHLAIEA